MYDSSVLQPLTHAQFFNLVQLFGRLLNLPLLTQLEISLWSSHTRTDALLQRIGDTPLVFLT